MLGKMKAYELAKELKITSKDLIERAKKLGIELSSHLSSLEDDQVSKIKKSYSNGEKVKDNSKKPSKESKVENKKAGPVIIRRQVILNDEEETKQEEDKKVNERKDIGFVKRRNNNDYNIVYRNKPNKPLTVNELFGLGKKEEKPKKEPVKEEKPQVVEEKKEEVKKPVETKTEQPKVSEVKETKLENASRDTSNNNAKRNDRPNRDEHSQRNNQYQQRNNYNNNNRYQNNNQQRDGFRQNNRYNNSNNGYNNNYRNNKNENYENRNNNFRNNNFNKGSRPLDDKRIDKKINDILETEIVEKENQRDYSTRVNYKARNSKNDELKQNKSSKSKRFNGHEEYDEGKLKNEIQYMWPGKEQQIEFEFTGPSVQAILDRIPKSKVIKREKDKVTIQATVVYGTGIKMTLLSQGSWVKVLSPQSFVDEMKQEVEKMMEGYR